MKCDPTMQILADRIAHEERVADLLTAAEAVLNATDTGTRLPLIRLDRAVRALRHSELFDRRHV